MESFPVKFCKSITSRWRRRSKYQRIANPRTSGKVIKLHGGGNVNAGRWRMRVRRTMRLKAYLRVLSPVKLLARLRDAYVDAMLALERRNVGVLTWTTSAEAFSTGTGPRARKASKKQKDFERRLALEIYKSLAASRGITAY